MISEQVVPTQGVPQPGRQMSRWQLAVIGAVVALAVVIGVVLGLTVLSGRTIALGSSAAYLPADTVMYGEARLDLSAGQSSALRSILQRFPAADADVGLLQAIGDAVDQGLAQSGSSLTYADDVAPWFDGRVAFAVLDYPLASLAADPTQLPNVALLFGVKDGAAASAFSDQLRELGGQSGSALTATQHAGVTIWGTDADGASGMSVGFAYAVTGDQLLVSTKRETIESLIDTHASSDSLATRQELSQLSAHLPSEWVGFFAMDTRQMFDAVRAAAEQEDPAVTALLDQYLADVPPFVVGSLGLEADAFVLHGATRLPGGDFAPTNDRRDLAGRVPASALLFADGNRVGDGLVRLITTMRATIATQPDGDQATAMLEQAEAALGADLEDFVRWIGSGALAVGFEEGMPYGGLVLHADDVDAARQRLGQLRGLIELGAGQSGQDLTITTDSVEGVEVTTISAATGTGGDVGSVVPAVVVQYAIDGESVLIGFGDQFVGRSLRLGDGDSLADAARFTTAVSRFGGEDNAGVMFLDLAGARSAIEQSLGVMLPSEYDEQIKPNVAPLDYFVNVTRVEGDVVVSRGGLVLR